MSKTSIEMVKEFHETFNHPVGTEPAMPGVERQEFRATFMKEEINEGLDAKDIVELADSLGD